MIIEYEPPVVVDLGSIADHTFGGFGQNDKVRDTTIDKWGEFRHGAGS